MTYYADRNLGKALPNRLRDAGLAVEIHDDHFAQDATDIEWLPEVAGRGWTILTKDDLTKHDIERDAIRAALASVVILVGANAPHSELGQNFLNTIQKVESLLAASTAPVAIKVYRPTPRELIDKGRPGSVKVVLS